MADASVQTTMTVTNDTPLYVIADGADTASPAASVGGPYSIGARVLATLNDPQPPTVTGLVENPEES